jgi:hypothetical protein
MIEEAPHTISGILGGAQPNKMDSFDCLKTPLLVVF